jgi:hypothetical protein
LGRNVGHLIDGREVPAEEHRNPFGGSGAVPSDEACSNVDADPEARRDRNPVAARADEESGYSRELRSAER